MTLIGLILTIAVAGFICWLVMQIPMPPQFRTVIMGFVVLFLVLWVLQSLGVVTGFSNLRIR